MTVLLRFLIATIAVAVIGASAVYLITDSPLAKALDQTTAQHRTAATRSPLPAAHATSQAAPIASAHNITARIAHALRSTLSVMGSLCWALVRILLALGIPLLLARSLARARRRYVRLWVIPFRADDAVDDDVRRLLESWHQQLLERWYWRVVRGQGSIALEVTMAPDTEGDRAACLSIVCPEHLVQSVEGSLLACYPDSRLVRDGRGLPPTGSLVRLKKRSNFVRALRPAPEEEGTRNIVDAILIQMTNVRGTAVVQYVLTPTPAVFDKYARRHFRRIESRGQRGFVLDPSAPGLRSMVVGQELKGGLIVQHRPLFFSDIRVAAASHGVCRSIAGTIRGLSAGENRLVERHMRPWALGPLYLRRLHAGIGNIIPGFSRSVLSSSELAGLWHLPSPGLRTVRVVRSALPRMPAPPEIAREPALALARDERGAVGIRPEDKSDGLGLIGGQKTGKTSVLIRTVQADAQDRDCALVVLMPKPGDALKALSMVPPDRAVHYLDLEHPEVGYSPLLGDGDPAMIADRVVDAFRDVNAEGDIRGSSDRYLRQAAQAAIGASRAGAVDGPPTLWHMYRLLLPNEAKFREHVVEALYADSQLTETATFFGRELPGDLDASPAQTSAKLDAPRNKLIRLLVGSIDKVLRHPKQIDLDELVRRREVLIVDGKMGTFGTENCRVMMQFMLSGLYGTLQRQQQLPEDQRVRVAVKVDEAHLIFNESFADALATLRSGGLEVVAAWQYGDQIQDEKVRSGMMSLLRQRCMFSMGESNDARQMSEIAMSVYSDLIRDDSVSRSRLRVTPDTIFNMPNHHCICSWISRGSRAGAFIAQTMPLTTDQAVVDRHLTAQRERGGFVPDRLPDPLPDLEWKGIGSYPTAELAAAAGDTRTGNSVAVAAVVPPSARNGSRPVDSGHAGAKIAAPPDSTAAELTTPPGSSVQALPELPAEDDGVAPRAPARAATRSEADTAVPETYRELDLDDVRGIIWDKAVPLRAGRSPEVTQRDLEILAALWSYRFLFSSQIWRRWWANASARAAQQGLKRMAEAGWVSRFKFQLGERGAQQRVYCLTQEGFELARGKAGLHGEHISHEATWREPGTADPRRILRDLHVNGWVLALREVVGPRAVGSWRGPSEGRLYAPRNRRGRGTESETIRPGQIVLGSNHRLQNFGAEQFEPVSPDATVELKFGNGEARTRVDLMIDLDRSRGFDATRQRLIAYDGLISGWARLVGRYKKGDLVPMVVIVSEDEHGLLNVLKIADSALTTRIAKAGTDEMSWPHPGRRGILFAVERDIHEGSLRALALPEHPPEVRIRAEGAAGEKCRPRRVHIVDPKLIGRR